MPVLFLYFLSGLAALVLEAVLLREMTWLLGSATSATALVLAAFLGGLSLGSFLLGRVADRAARPLRLYGLLEIGAGLAAALVLSLLGPGREALLVPIVAGAERAAGRGATLAIASALLLLPTSLLGGTFPMIGRFAIRDPRRIGGSLGLLYGANTLGGAVGVFVAGFVLFETLGVGASGAAAASLGIAVGLAAIVLDRFGSANASAPIPDRGGRAEPEPPAQVRTACLLAAAMGGAAVLGYEVIWTRLLSLPMRSYAYSFSLMLSLFLLGLVLGSLAVSLLPARTDPVRLLGWVEVGMGLHVASSALWLPALLAPPEGVRSFSEFLARAALRAAVVVLPPTFLSGMALPLAATGVARSRDRIGGDVGILYAVNTAGSIVGALAAGLLLLPWIGAVRSLVVLAAWNAAAGALVLLSMPRERRAGLLAGAAAAACLVALVLSPGPLLDAFLRSSVGREKIGQVLLFRESATDTIAIVRKDYGFHDENAKSLITNGVAMSATVRPVRRYMAVEGHVPVLLAKDPSKALVICLGTGITLGAVAAHPEVRSIDAVELSEGVIEGLPLFAAENGEAYRDPRVRIVREDGRHFLDVSRDRYGVITLEPPPPIVAGASHLYSLDFYEICKRRLLPGGVVAQWLPLHAQSLASARMTARTFLEAFPQAQLWLPSVRDAVLVGSETPLSLQLKRARAFSDPSAMLESPEALLGTFLLDRDGIARWAGDVPVLTDEHPRMEFFRASGTNMADREIATLLSTAEEERWSWIEGIDPAFRPLLDAEARALRLYVRAESTDDPRAGVEAARLSRGTEFFLYPLGCTREQLDALGRMAPEEALRKQEARCGDVYRSGLLGTP